MFQLLDLCSRLDVTEVQAPADVQEMAEMAMLRLLLDVRAMCVCMCAYVCM